MHSNDLCKRIERAGYVLNAGSRAAIESWCAGYSILLSGPAGVGKTMLAGLLVNKTRVVRMAKLGAMDREDLGKWLDGASSIEIACDDIGLEPAQSEYGVKFEAFGEVVESRHQAHQRTIYTTNLTAAEIAARYGERTCSRLFGHVKAHRIEGSDRRKASPVKSNPFEMIEHFRLSMCFIHRYTVRLYHMSPLDPDRQAFIDEIVGEVGELGLAEVEKWVAKLKGRA